MFSSVQLKENFKLKKLILIYLMMAILFGAGLMSAPLKSAHADGVVTSCKTVWEWQELKSAVSSGGLVKVQCNDEIGFDITLEVTHDTTIIGGNFTVNPNSNFRLFHVWPGVKLTLIDDSLTGGNSVDFGGAIYGEPDSQIDIENSSLFGNKAGYLGGAIYLNKAKLTTTNVTFDKNTARSGSAIYSDNSSVILNNTKFFRNYAYADKAGGAVYMEGGSMKIDTSYFEDNTSDGDAGAVVVYGPYTTDPGVTINRTTFHHNTAKGWGGALYTVDIYDGKQDINITNSTFYENAASKGGAIYQNNQAATIRIGNSTFTQNKATTQGGAIAQGRGFVTLRSDTIVNNVAAIGGNIYTTDKEPVSALNTILYSNVAGANCFGANGNAVSSMGYNIQWPGTCNPTILTTDPKLGNFAYNGGATMTISLIFGSPAINAGGSAGCSGPLVSNLDQRGQLRVGTCDIGAYEYIMGPIKPRHTTDFNGFPLDTLSVWSKTTARTVSAI